MVSFFVTARTPRVSVRSNSRRRCWEKASAWADDFSLPVVIRSPELLVRKELPVANTKTASRTDVFPVPFGDINTVTASGSRSM
jgi:hypothetical protein